jgi:hypothetical protein
MSNIGTVKSPRFQGGKYELQLGGRTIAKSKDRDYFEYHIARGDVPKIVEADITSVIYEDGSAHNVALTPTAATLGNAANSPVTLTWTVDERFDMMDELITMTVTGTGSKAMCIGGRGGIGKSFAVQKVLNRMGKVDAAKAIAEAMERATEEQFTMDDTDEEVKEKVRALSTADTIGDYRIIKGYASASALYRILYENRHRTIVFDDCDSVLKNDDAVNVLKSALDSYEERWVSWNVNSQGNDLPPCFKFEGQVIFVTNMDMDKVPEPILTRCFPVNVAMTPEQRLVRMRTVLADVMPEVDMSFKLEAIELLQEHVHVTKNINFRSLMKTISIRTSTTANWKRLALFSLIEN